MSFFCYICKQTFDNIKLTINHLQKDHNCIEGSCIRCIRLTTDQMYCKTVFASFKSLRSHLNNGRCDLRSVLQPTELVKGLDSQCDPKGIETPANTITEKDVRNNKFKDFVSAFSNMASEIDNFDISNAAKNKIFEIIKETSSNIHKLTMSSLSTCINVPECRLNVDAVHHFASNEIEKYESTHKRRKITFSQKQFVQPVECTQNESLGEKFHYISILNTLEALFANE